MNGTPSSLQRPDHFDTRRILVRRAVAEIEEEVVAVLRQGGHLLDGGRLLQHRDVPARLGQERARVAGPVVVGERVGVEVLCGQQADAQGRSARPRSSSAPDLHAGQAARLQAQLFVASATNCELATRLVVWAAFVRVDCVIGIGVDITTVAAAAATLIVFRTIDTFQFRFF